MYEINYLRDSPHSDYIDALSRLMAELIANSIISYTECTTSTLHNSFSEYCQLLNKLNVDELWVTKNQ